MEDKVDLTTETSRDSIDENIYYKFNVDDLITMDVDASVIKDEYHSLVAEKGVCHIPLKARDEAYIDQVLKAVTVLVMNRKIETIDASKQRLFKHIQNDQDSWFEESLYVLTDIMNHYKFYLDDPDYLETNLVRVRLIKEEAQKNSDLYQKEAQDRLEKKVLFRINKNVDQTFEMIQKQFEEYRMQLYLFAFATFLEVMLSQNYNEQYLDDQIHLLRKYAYRYRDVYSGCYEQLESYLRSAVESRVLKAGAGVSHILGKGIAKIPVINRGPVDEKLIELGDTISDYDEEAMKERMENFRNNKESGMNLFIENIIIVKSLCNNTGELLWDEEYLYVKKPIALVS